jgi:uncharacterized membrane-anchored protein
MPDGGEPTTGEVWRAFLDFRQESRDQYKFVLRLLIGGIAASVIGNIVATLTAIGARPPS